MAQRSASAGRRRTAGSWHCVGGGRSRRCTPTTTSDGSTFRSRRVTNRSFPGVLNIQQFDPLIAPYYMGDYLANVSDGRRQYFAWGDNRDQVHNWLYPSGRHDPNVYFARR